MKTTQGKWRVMEQSILTCPLIVVSDDTHVATIDGELSDTIQANAELIALAGNLNQKYDLELLTSFITTIENRQEFGCPSAIVSTALKNIKR